MNHVPYRGGGPALNDLIGGQVKFFFSNGASSVGHVRSATLRAVAHTARERLKSLPDIPIVAETLPGFEAYEFNAVFAPAGTPPAIIEKLNAGPQRGAAPARRHPAPQRTQRRVQGEHGGRMPRLHQRGDRARWAEVIRQGNIKLG